MSDRDLKALLDACSEASGFFPSTPGQIDRAYEIVQAWRDDGIDFEKVVIPTIRSVIADSSPKDFTSSLNRFNKPVRHEHARQKGQNGKTYRPPPSPVFEIAGEDPEFITMRKELADAIGAQVYASLANGKVQFERIDDRPIIRINGPNATRLKEGETGEAIRRIARQHGFSEVW